MCSVSGAARHLALMKGKGNGFSALCRWMASKAEELGVDIFPGFAAAHVLHNSDGSVGGVQIRDRGDRH